MKSWRAIPLKVGASYRMRSDVASSHDSLRSGQVVEFVAADYSHYDNLTVLAFCEQQTGSVVGLWWFDDEAELNWWPFEEMRA